MTTTDRPHDEPPTHDTPGWRDDEPDGEAAFDPYFYFASDTQFRFIQRDDDSLSVLIELTKPLPSLAREISILDERVGPFIRISPLYTHPPEGLKEMTYITAQVSSTFFEFLERGELNGIVRRFELCSPLPKSVRAGAARRGDDGKSGPQPTPAQQPQGSPQTQAVAAATLPQKNAPVVMGIIDDGIAFANVRFRGAPNPAPGAVPGAAPGPETSRVHAIWCQDLPGGAGTGLVIPRADINNMLTNCAPNGIVDEDAVYRSAGLDFLHTGHKSWARRFGHGTHVLDIMAGMDPADVNATSPVIAAVQLPVTVTEQTRGTLLTSYALDGMQWILKQAEEVAAENGASSLPCVINLSYGTLDGPHDGTGPLAAAIDERLAALEAAGKRVAVVLPAGNGHLSQIHAHVTLPPDPTRPANLRWRVLPDTRTPNFLEVWLPANVQWRMVEVRVRTPGGHVTPWIRQGDPRHCWPSKAKPLLWIRHRGRKPTHRRKMILIAVFPTAPTGAADLVAASGIYSVQLRNVGSFPLEIDAWIGRNDTPGGYPIRGRQSRFDDAHYLETRYRRDGTIEEEDDGLSYVARAASLNGVATGTRTIVAGSVRGDDLSCAPYSAGGPTMVPGTGPPRPRDGPDAMTIADSSHVRGGILAAGTRSSSTLAMRGTSVSAPQLARFVAREFAGGKPGNRDAVMQEAQLREDALTASGSIWPQGPIKPAPWAFRGGSGRIDLTADLPPANRRR